MRVSRTELLQALDAVSPGLAAKENVDQSSCFVFKDNVVMTYNEEIACRHACPLELTGAVPSGAMLALLNKMSEDEVEIEEREGEFIIKGRHKEAGLRREAEVLLPIDDVEEPGKFKKLHEDFVEAVDVAGQCTGKDEGAGFSITCVHLHPEYVEACDNYQMVRFPLETGVQKPMLVKQTSIKHIVGLEMYKMSETKAWLHFKNASGLVLSCRRYLEDFPDLSEVLKIGKTSKIVLPGGLAEAIEKAELFSGENADSNNVLIELRRDRLRIKGEGSKGWYREMSKVSYGGPPIAFLISPKLLTEICKRHNECEVAKGRLCINSGRFVYVSCTVEADDNGKEEQG